MTAAMCLALAMLGEAESVPKPYDANIFRLMVAQVVQHRVGHEPFGKTVCEVIFHPHAFAVRDRPIRTQGKQWEAALTIAYNLELFPDLTDGATFFYRMDIHPLWADGMDCHVHYANHAFCKPMVVAQR